jgi:hypothetical protein
LIPPELSLNLRLDVQITPRHSVYVGSEKTAEFIVDAALSFLHGSPYSDVLPGNYGSITSDKLHFIVRVEGDKLLANSVLINTTDNVFTFDIARLSPRTAAYPVELSGAAENTNARFTAKTDLYYLPDKPDGSVVKVDYLHGSLLYRNAFTKNSFRPIFPYGFYGNYGGFFVSDANLTAYATKNFNTLNPVTAFTDGDMTNSIAKMDELNMLFQYDMRGSYQNLTSLAAQLPLVKDHPSLLTWYTADEPDGWGYPLDSTRLAYDLLAQLDKYHPTGLVLNCQNYYFRNYASGADIIMEDAYPIGINATWSTRWNTTCNSTYGDCGCDNCIGSLLDVPSRIDDFHRYQSWLGGSWPRKPVWTVPQAFSSPGEYWSRAPTTEESWAMDLLAFNHGAKGRLAWLYPPPDELIEADSQLAKVITVSPVSEFLTESNPVLLQNGSAGGLDVAYWPLHGKALIGVVNPVNTTIDTITIRLPEQIQVSVIDDEPWGTYSWGILKGKGGAALVTLGSLQGFGTSLIILS